MHLCRYDIRRLGRSEPRLFATNTTSVVATAQALGAVGLTGKALVLAIIRWPSLLLVPPPAVASVVSFLTAPLVGFSEAEVGSVLRSAPWLLGDAEAMLRPAAEHLVDRGLKPNLVVRAFPQVLELDVATELAPRLDFLVDEVGLDPVADLPSTVHAFPLLLGLDVDSRMRPVQQPLPVLIPHFSSTHPVFLRPIWLVCLLVHFLSYWYLSNISPPSSGARVFAKRPWIFG